MSFQWVLSHRVILGSTVADNLARMAQTESETSRIPLSQNDARNTLREMWVRVLRDTLFENAVEISLYFGLIQKYSSIFK